MFDNIFTNFIRVSFPDLSFSKDKNRDPLFLIADLKDFHFISDIENFVKWPHL